MHEAELQGTRDRQHKRNAQPYRIQSTRECRHQLVIIRRNTACDERERSAEHGNVQDHHQQHIRHEVHQLDADTPAKVFHYTRLLLPLKLSAGLSCKIVHKILHFLYHSPTYTTSSRLE